MSGCACNSQQMRKTVIIPKAQAASGCAPASVAAAMFAFVLVCLVRVCVRTVCTEVLCPEVVLEASRQSQKDRLKRGLVPVKFCLEIMLQKHVLHGSCA
jgi:hypothetical protein